MTLGKVLGLSEDLCLAVDYGLSGGPQLEDSPYIIQIYPLGSHYFAGQRLNGSVDYMALILQAYIP